MKVYLIGVGMGNPDLLTIQAVKALESCQLLVGSRRMLDCFGDSSAQKVEAATPEKIAKVLAGHQKLERAAVLLSGDCGFYSAGSSLSRMAEWAELEYLPGISSLQYFCAKLKISWENVRVVSLHGRDGDLIQTVRENPRTFVLTGGANTVEHLCAWLDQEGLGQVEVHVGEDLSYPNERISCGQARTRKNRSFSPLSVMLVTNSSFRRRKIPLTHGVPDHRFLRGEVPMTKEEVRAVSVAKLGLEQGWTVWDVGAGTGSVSVEIARVLRGGTVYAVERNPEAIQLLEQNRMRFELDNLKIVEGLAPGALKDLPTPQGVFIGGSSGGISPIIRLAVDKNPWVRLVVNAITLETVGAVLNTFNELGIAGLDVVQVAVAEGKIVGGNHMMIGRNPIYILSGGGPGRGI